MLVGEVLREMRIKHSAVAQMNGLTKAQIAAKAFKDIVIALHNDKPSNDKGDSKREVVESTSAFKPRASLVQPQFADGPLWIMSDGTVWKTNDYDTHRESLQDAGIDDSRPCAVIAGDYGAIRAHVCHGELSLEIACKLSENQLDTIATVQLCRTRNSPIRYEIFKNGERTKANGYVRFGYTASNVWDIEQ